MVQTQLLRIELHLAAARLSTCPFFEGCATTPKARMDAVENHLIELLPYRDRTRLLAIREPVELVLSEVLCEPGKPILHVYFPTRGAFL